MSTRFNNELILESNNFHQFERRTDKFALAQVIQNLCLIEKGTYPNQPDLGVGIENYLFEKLLNDTENDLKTEIENQIEKFAPSPYVVEVNVESNLINKNIALSLNFIIRSVNPDQKENIEVFGIIFGRNEKTQKVVSKIII